MVGGFSTFFSILLGSETTGCFLTGDFSDFDSFLTGDFSTFFSIFFGLILSLTGFGISIFSVLITSTTGSIFLGLWAKQYD